MTKQEFIAWALLQGGTVPHRKACDLVGSRMFYGIMVKDGYMVWAATVMFEKGETVGMGYSVTEKGLGLMK